MVAEKDGCGYGAELKNCTARSTTVTLVVTAEPAAGLAPLPEHPSHGLWVARQVTSQMQALSGPGGTRVTLTFERPAAQ